VTQAPTVPALLDARTADVGGAREASRRRRLLGLAVVLGVPTAYLWLRIAQGDPFNVFAFPHLDPLVWMQVLIAAAILGSVALMFLGGGRSPHVMYRPEQLDTRLDDVVGLDLVKEDVVRSLNMFLSHASYAAETGAKPRRGLLFEGQPGTGKTYLAKAMAAEAGVPFLFVSATEFQSSFYGATARKIRSYFKALRKAARQEGGAIGFIEEIDAIAVSRGGLGMTVAPELAPTTGMPLACGGLTGLQAGYTPASGGTSAPTIHSSTIAEGVGGVVNELLVQMQSFDAPTGWQKFVARCTDALNLFLPPHRQLTRPGPVPTNVLLIAATNRADALDPALLRPGRFDRRLTFEPPTKAGRRALIDHFLARRPHEAELDSEDSRDGLAAATPGYTPVMLEHLFDEAAVAATRRGQGPTISRADLDGSRLIEEIGMGQPVAYTAHEKRLIATHESGHAVLAWLVAPQRRLEVLTIIKRREALGLLAHNDREDVFTRSRAEMLALIQIAFGGQCAEEIFFGDVSTGPGGDLSYATTVAAQMVGACGMADTLVSFGAVASAALSDTNLVGRVLADSAGRAAVEELLQRQKLVAHQLLDSHRHLVEALRDALLERHELVGAQITDVLSAAAAAHPLDAGPSFTPQAVVDLRDTARSRETSSSAGQ